MLEFLAVFVSFVALLAVAWVVDKTKKARDYYDGDY
jgi:hypothetical protein